jgi:antitoxin (DNA-binding transcriptional repressor) of toxin-antitoxin stability system/predicted nucleic acid-binding protein
VRQAGVREARQNLSVLLEYVRKGHEIVITERGRPVARLVAPLPLSPKPFPGRSAFRRAMPALKPPLSRTLAHGARNPTYRGRTSPVAGPLYLDPTALAKVYLPERDSAELDAALVDRRDLTVSELSITELIAAFAARKGDAPSKNVAASLQGSLRQDLESGIFRRVELSPPTHRAAERLALALALRDLVPRASMVLHLALAMTAGVAAVVTFDQELARAAQAVGLSTVPAVKP